MRSCPICGAAAPRVLYRQSFENLAGSLMDGYDVVCCATCGFTYASDLPSAEEFAAYYANMSRYESATSYFRTPEDRARCEAIVDLLDALVPARDRSILDVGCSTGALLHAFKRRGYPEVEGLDPSPACAVYARENYDITVRTGTTDEVPELPRRYGLVILSAVLEHLLDPRQALLDVGEALDDGGLLFVEVPDVEGFAEGARAPFQEFSVEHINFFSSPSLANVMGTAGFEPVEVRRLFIPWLSGLKVPAIHAVFRKTSTVRTPEAEGVSEAGILAYVAECERIEARVTELIEELADRGEPVLVWGIGTHTRHLLKGGALDRLNVAAWIDSDPKYQGTEMRGIPVIGPADVSERGEPILISSGYVHHEIARQIRDDLVLPNELVLLYE